MVLFRFVLLYYLYRYTYKHFLECRIYLVFLQMQRKIRISACFYNVATQYNAAGSVVYSAAKADIFT
jgi:hypothetical protein